jgi:hypothetical protein
MNDNIFEIENIIPLDYQNYIEKIMLGSDFPWYYNPNLVSPDQQLLHRVDNHQGFNHLFLEAGKPSTYFQSVYPLVLSITSQECMTSANNLVRMRANLTLNAAGSSLQHHLPHIDTWRPHWVAIYYVNDSDGDTIIYNETNDTYNSGQTDINKSLSNNFTIKRRVTPKKGKVLIFEGKYYHTSSWPTVNKCRSVININLENLVLP